VLSSAALTAGPALALGPSWLDPQTILESLGDWALWGAMAIVFAECGLLLGFFLPGDSLLFTVGMLIGRGTIDQPLWLACTLLTVSAFVGNVVGYEIGRASGPAIFRRPNSRIFKQEYVDKTVDFFDKYGARAIVLARFVPIVRTFITVTAGVGKMDRRRYLTYSGIGAVLWAARAHRGHAADHRRGVGAADGVRVRAAPEEPDRHAGTPRHRRGRRPRRRRSGPGARGALTGT
jgi:membrane-associated protein